MKAAQSLPLHVHLPGLCQSVQHTTIFSLVLQGFLEKASLPSDWDGSSLWQCSLSSWQNLESPGRRVYGWAVSICYAICLGKTHFNGEREHPLARGPGLCELEERTQPAFLSLCFLTAVTWPALLSSCHWISSMRTMNQVTAAGDITKTFYKKQQHSHIPKVQAQKHSYYT